MNELSGAGLGHNQPPPIDFAEVLRPDLLRPQIEVQHADLLTRLKALLDAASRFHAATPEGIPDAETLDKAADFEKQLKAFAKKAEAAREDFKGPFNEANKVIQAFFKATIIDVITAAANEVNAKRTAFLQAQAAAERRRREEEATAAQKQAEEAARAATVAQTTTAIDTAIEREQAALEAQTAAQVKPAELVRRTSDLGTTSSLRQTLTFDVVDKKLIPAHLMEPVSSKIMEAGRVAKDPVAEQPVPGVRFRYETRAQ